MSKIKYNWAVLAGHFVECFDATIYGFYAVLLAPLFFPQDSISPVLLSFCAFSAGFLARPLGAIVLGTLGDKIGRTGPLVASMALVGVPTLVIGLLPSYQEIGLWATIILFSCRLAQGFFYGAEFAGVNVYLYENYHQTNRLGARVGFLVAFGSFGAVFATGLGAFFTMEIMPPWAWRIPFILGGVSAFAVYLWRRNLHETEEFKKAQQKKEILAFPLTALFRYKGLFLTAVLMMGLNTMPLYIITIFGNQLFKEMGYTTSQSMLLNMSTLTFDSIMIIFLGRLGDLIGFQRQIVLGCVWMIVASFPCFYLITYYPSTLTIFTFIVTISSGSMLVTSCTMPYINGFFPANCRFSGAALSSTLGSALIAGNTPLVANYLVHMTGTKMAPAVLLVTSCLSVILGISWKIFSEKRGASYQQPSSLAA